MSTASRRAIQRVLNGALHVEARSALAYGLQVSEGLEQVLPDDVRKALTDIRSQLGAASSELANRILALGGTPDPGNFPLVATNYNFLNVGPLLQRLEPTVLPDADTLDALAQAAAGMEIHDLIVGLAKQKRAQHATLKGLLEKITAAAKPAAEAPAAS